MNPLVDLQSLLQSAYLVRAAYDAGNVKAGHTQGHVAYYPADNTCVVSFAGSNDRHDWGDNFNFFHRKYVGDRGAARVSAGFYGHAETLALAVLDEMKKQNVPDDAKIKFQGHSLGGVAIHIAICETPRFNRLGNEAITFAAPKAGNQGWVNHFNARCRVRLLRVVRDGDPVPNMPPLSPWWRHVGMEYRTPAVTKGFDHPLDSYIASILAAIQNS